MNNKLIILLFFINIYINNSIAKNDTEFIDSENALMWKISGNNLKQPSYLYGTIHAIPIDDYFLGKNTLRKLKSCTNLVMEMDIAKIDEKKLAELSLLPDNKTAKDYMSENEYNQLEDFLIQQFGMNKYVFENVYSRLKPFFVDQFVMLSIIGHEKKIYEEELNNIASMHEIKRSGLETFDQQLSIIDTIPIDLQYKNLIKNIDDYETQRKNYDDLVEAFKRQDLKYLSDKFESEFTGELDIYKTVLLDERNNNWVNKIEKFISKESCFIAVGAGHLSGKDGLIKLLRKKGYTISPLKN